MANSIAKLAILLTTDASGVRTGFAQARGEVNKFNGSLSGIFSSFGGTAGVAAAVGTALVTGLAAATKWSIQLAEETKIAAINFRTMIGDAQKANTLLAGITDISLNSSFTQGDLQGAAQKMLAFGVASENVLPALKVLGDISLGDANKLQLLTIAFSQTQAAGKLMGQDLLQMVNAGFNPLQEIARVTGRDMNDLRAAMSDGAISAEMVALAFKSATEEGGRFNEAIKAQQDTLGGQWSMLMEGIGQAVKPAGAAIANTLTDSLKGWNMVLAVGTQGVEKYVEGLTKTANAAGESAAKLREMTAQIKSTEMVFKGWDTEGFAGSLNRFNDLQKGLGERGADFASRFSTPAQNYLKAVAEAAELQRDGAISAQVYEQAIAKAKESLLESSDAAKSIMEAMKPTDNTALSRSSGAAFSEIGRMQQQQALDAALQQQQLEEQKKANALLERALRAVERNEPVRINEVDF